MRGSAVRYSKAIQDSEGEPIGLEGFKEIERGSDEKEQLRTGSKKQDTEEKQGYTSILSDV